MLVPALSNFRANSHWVHQRMLSLPFAVVYGTHEK